MRSEERRRGWRGAPQCCVSTAVPPHLFQRPHIHARQLLQGRVPRCRQVCGAWGENSLGASTAKHPDADTQLVVHAAAAAPRPHPPGCWPPPAAAARTWSPAAAPGPPCAAPPSAPGPTWPPPAAGQWRPALVMLAVSCQRAKNASCPPRQAHCDTSHHHVHHQTAGLGPTSFCASATSPRARAALSRVSCCAAASLLLYAAASAASRSSLLQEAWVAGGNNSYQWQRLIGRQGPTRCMSCPALQPRTLHDTLGPGMHSMART